MYTIFSLVVITDLISQSFQYAYRNYSQQIRSIFDYELVAYGYSPIP